MDWISSPWLGFDLETTGVDVNTARVVTAAVVLRRGGAFGEKPDLVRTWLADPGVDIPQQATDVHGISTEYARIHGRPVVNVIDEVAATLVDHFQRGFPVVAFNGSYDFTLLENELKRHGVPTMRERLDGPLGPIIDPLILDRTLDRFRKGKRTLTSMAPVYGVEADENAHTAEVDVAMTLDILAAMAEHFQDELADLSGPELHAFQARAHRDWAENFEEFLKKSGKPDAHISRSWPLLLD